jgi:hypothetical protein
MIDRKLGNKIHALYAPQAQEDNERYSAYQAIIPTPNLWMEQAQKPLDVPISNYQGA